MLVYDVGMRDSFEHAQSWYERAKQLGGQEMETVLIGNKNDIEDMERQVFLSNLLHRVGISFH